MIVASLFIPGGWATPLPAASLLAEEQRYERSITPLVLRLLAAQCRRTFKHRRVSCVRAVLATVGIRHSRLSAATHGSSGA